MKAVTVWIALSAQGHPAPFIGYSFQRQMLNANYRATFGADLAAHGYRAVKVRMTAVPSARRRTHGEGATTDSGHMGYPPG